MVKAVAWKGDFLQLIDQRELPTRESYLDLHDVESVFDAIKNLVVRGAPAIGITAAYGLYIGMRDLRYDSTESFWQQLDQKIDYLSAARPTAVNLTWALKEAKSHLSTLGTDVSVNEYLEELLTFAKELHKDDEQRCERIADHGQSVIPQNARIVTHCNTGALATGGIGTALGVIYRAHQSGKSVEVFANETRPVLQGARLTAWELAAAGIPAHLMCDSMSAALMKQHGVDVVIVGADRVAADGSAANKIGTYNLAIAAQYHDIPFYVAAPLSTFDLEAATGADIPIEQRDGDEIRRVFDQCLITVKDIPVWSPAFDVTPPELIAGIITEAGIVRAPYVENIQAVFNQN